MFCSVICVTPFNHLSNTSLHYLTILNKCNKLAFIRIKSLLHWWAYCVSYVVAYSVLFSKENAFQPANRKRFQSVFRMILSPTQINFFLCRYYSIYRSILLSLRSEALFRGVVMPFLPYFYFPWEVAVYVSLTYLINAAG